MRHPDYPIWSLLGLVAVLLPAAWHWRARNISTLAIITWLAMGNLSFFVNTIVWADNYADRSPVWCDISELNIFRFPSCIDDISQSPVQCHLVCYARLLPLANA